MTERERMIDVSIEAGRLVMQHGSPALQAAMRVMLMVLGEEIAGMLLSQRELAKDDRREARG